MMNAEIQHKSVIIWLLTSCLLIWAMIMLGGVTRLTQSGLSIVEWKPITGIVPPLNDADWQTAFQDYKQFPEYKMMNQEMDLKEFKFIYLMEFSHRLLGRLLGLVFIIPLVIFWRRQRLSGLMKKQSLTILALGFLQGAVGWYMVKSGLVKVPAVSHYRLALHLGLAFWLLGLTAWMLWDYMNGQKSRRQKIPKVFLFAFILQIFTMIYGAFVAGLKAGLFYNTFPLMEEQWLPTEWAFHKPLWINFFENPTTVQWMHRVLAFLSLGAIWCGYFRWRSFAISRYILLWVFSVTVQVILGAFTIIYAVPVSLGTLHQGWAAVVMIVGLFSLHRCRQLELHKSKK
jgi:cytochrome c oxidase assembly protein subunit 15